MHGELKDYRQPMVTSLGIILGFMLNFLAGWGIRTGEAIVDFTDLVVLAGSTASVVLMCATLYRMLRADVAEAEVARYYRATLRLYVAAIALAFGCFLAAILL